MIINGKHEKTWTQRDIRKLYSSLRELTANYAKQIDKCSEMAHAYYKEEKDIPPGLIELIAMNYGFKRELEHILRKFFEVYGARIEIKSTQKHIKETILEQIGKKTDAVKKRRYLILDEFKADFEKTKEQLIDDDKESILSCVSSTVD